MEKGEKKIITWHLPPSPRQVNRRKKLLKKCGVEAKCKIVYPVPLGLSPDAVIFSQVDRSLAPPVRTHSHQVFVLQEMGAPSTPQQQMWPPAWRSVFNWTWSYRRDTEIWQPFGRLTSADTVPPFEFFLSLTDRKSRPLAWIPRSCPPDGRTSSGRNEFVTELRKFIPVADFGACSNKACARDDANCSQVLSEKFYFLLALEDDMCKDYITEVFYRAWQEGTYVIPVVRGGTDYAAYFPHGTYIDVNWFDDVRQLFEFLAGLMADRKLYAELLWRKAHWVKAPRVVEDVALCHLCYKLHHLTSNRKTYPDIRQWYKRSACKMTPST